MSYVIKDHQGSMYATVTGNTVERYSFDAWGRRRNPQTLSYDNVTASFDRGYTLHEHYDDFGLINMNGRLYDPLVGRMLSPDIVIQDEQNSQAYNRYSYCFNNPLRYTDPSGYISVGGFRNRTSTLLYFDYWGTNSNTRSSFSTDESLGNQIPVDDWFENEETGEIYYNVNMHQGDEGTGAMKGSGWKWLGPNGMFGEGLFNSDMSLVARNNGIIDIDADGNFNMEMMLREEKAKALMASVGYKQVNKQEIVYSSTYTQSISDGRHSFRFTYGTSATYSEKVCYVPNGFDEISRVQLGKTLYGNINQATGAFPEVSRYSISYGNLSFWRKVGKAMQIGTGIHDYVNYYDGGSVKSYYESGALNSLINDFLRKYPK